RARCAASSRSRGAATLHFPRAALGLLDRDASLVRFRVRVGHPDPGRRVRPDRARGAHDPLRPDGERQDARGVPVGAGSAGKAPGERGAGIPRRLRVAAEGARLRRRAQTAPAPRPPLPPRAGTAAAPPALGAPFRPPRVSIRTGDTSARERRAMGREPGQILITTPESFYLLLGSRARETLRTVDTVIVDEIHVLAPGKRGAHLALSLERLVDLAGREPQRIGLSATQNPLAHAAHL